MLFAAPLFGVPCRGPFHVLKGRFWRPCLPPCWALRGRIGEAGVVPPLHALWRGVALQRARPRGGLSPARRLCLPAAGRFEISQSPACSPLPPTQQRSFHRRRPHTDPAAKRRCCGPSRGAEKRRCCVDLRQRRSRRRRGRDDVQFLASKWPDFQLRRPPEPSQGLAGRTDDASRSTTWRGRALWYRRGGPDPVGHNRGGRSGILLHTLTPTHPPPTLPPTLRGRKYIYERVPP